jgi:hypothetical protein
MKMPDHSVDSGWTPEEQVARALLRGVAQESKATSTFAGWWVAAVGALLGFTLAHADEARRLLSASGFFVTLLTLTAAGACGLVSEWFSLMARRQLAIALNFEQVLPKVMNQHPKLNLGRALDLALSTQPRLARFNAQRGKRRAMSFPIEVRRLASDALAARQAFWQTMCVNVMVFFTLAYVVEITAFFLFRLPS